MSLGEEVSAEETPGWPSTSVSAGVARMLGSVDHHVTPGNRRRVECAGLRACSERAAAEKGSTWRPRWGQFGGLFVPKRLELGLESR